MRWTVGLGVGLGLPLSKLSLESSLESPSLICSGNPFLSLSLKAILEY